MIWQKKKKKANETVGCTKRLMNSSREMTSAVYMALVRNTGTVSPVLESSMLKTKLKKIGKRPPSYLGAWKNALK